MNIEIITKESFTVIGIEGVAQSCDDTVQRLWAQANSRFSEVEALAKRNSDGSLAGIWGAMSDCSRSFMPWENNFSCGLYLAGVECKPDAQPPEGWTKWVLPGFEYIRAECDGSNIFSEVLDYMDKNDMKLVGAVQDYTCPANGKNYMYFPIRSL